MGAYSYTTEDEVNFMRNLQASKPISAANYARSVLSGRRWDASVDVATVEAEARRILGQTHPDLIQ
jgi:hypothetical protein